MTVDPYLQSLETSLVNRSLSQQPIPQITGMKLAADIIFNGLTLNTIDVNGVVWVCTDIDGWWELPDPIIRDVPRGWADGSYDVGGRWGARQLNLKGSILTPGPEYAAAARNTLLEASALIYDGGWLQVAEDPQKAAFVRLSGKPQIASVNARGRMDFTIGLRAADPLKYSWNDLEPDGYTVYDVPAYSVSGGESGYVTVTNAGNWDTTVRLEIDGPIVGPGIISNDTTGELILVISPIQNGTMLEIDTYRQEVALDGDTEDARSLIDVLANWIVLAPGDNTIYFEDYGDSNSTATMRIYFRSAWIG